MRTRQLILAAAFVLISILLLKGSLSLSNMLVTAPVVEIAMVDELGVEFALPASWPKELRPPNRKTNCVRCHMEIGGVYSDAVVHFAGSTHDFMGLSCNGCHGGDTSDDEYAHARGGYAGTHPGDLRKKCSACHSAAAEIFKKSVHFQEKFDWRYPTCYECHGDHAIGRGDTVIASACTECHGAKATASIGSGESEIIWKSRTEGAHGNTVSIAMLAEGKTGPLSVEHRTSDGGTDIVIRLATDDQGKPTSLAEDVIAMITGERELFHIIYCEEGDGALGEGLVEPTPKSSLSGGADFDAELPAYGELVRANDALRGSLRTLNKRRDERPPELVTAIAALRKNTMELAHGVPEKPDPAQVKSVVEETKRLKKEIDSFLGKGV
jgi:hypothetical protein